MTKINTGNLIPVETLTTRYINQRKSPSFNKTVPKIKKDDFILDGWEEVPSKLKKSVRIKKDKKHNDAFEDRVWALCAKLGFDYINENNQYKLEYDKGLKKQIDVFCFDNEVILIIECKSSEKRRKVSYQKDINELAGLKNKLRISAQDIADKKLKVAFIFCTNNAILSNNDKLRLKSENIFHFNQDLIEYYEQLSDHLGMAAKYQLFGHLFSGQKIPHLENRIPAIKGKVSAGHTIYSFCIDPMYLLKIGFVLHRTDTNPDATHAYQRLIKKSRLKQIANYIDDSGYFPNSIIINIETKGNRDLQFDTSGKITHDGNTNFGVLNLPKNYRSAFIIDGQHRLYGYSMADPGSNHTIPVIAFHNLPIEEQSKIFVDINHTQKSVPANLLQSIMADFNWGSSNEKRALSALKTRIFVELNSEDDSPFYKRVQLAEEKKTNKRCLTIQTLKTWGLNPVKYLGTFRGDVLIKTGHLSETTHNKTLNKSKDFLKTIFIDIENKLTLQWELGSEEGGFISMNVGVAAVLRILDDILDYSVIKDRIEPHNMDGFELASACAKYISPVISFVQSLDLDSIKKLRGFLGSGGVIKVLRNFQESIYKKYPDFEPEGLVQWIRDTSGRFDNEGHELGHTYIEPIIDSFVQNKLKEIFGVKEKKWWIEGIPKKIQKDCANKKIEKGAIEPEENFLNTIHYMDIISNNWNELGNYFTPPGFSNESKSKKLSWLKDFNDIRQKYTHPQREPITEKELAFLKELNAWLKTQLH
ncbi:DGQHR domain-containing protein [Candidatus Woesearchaeota archaeon]|jgi:DNA sulfur modification protein DndB|nr:DGQHR domain-containing protein [Candidatus Woesearchaeota archaeon]